MRDLPQSSRKVRLADQPSRFRYKQGDKVVQCDAEGYADLEWAGVIVDGVWQGDPSGGAFTEDYWIQRDRGAAITRREK